MLDNTELELRLGKTTHSQRHIECKLADVVPKAYASVSVRIVSIKSREKEDELGKRSYVYGIAEDSSFKMPFMCYKVLVQFDKNGIFRFENAYVHEFEDRSLLLVLTDYSRIIYLPDEDPAEYQWQAQIGEIKRPLGYSRVTLEGTMSKIFNSSGLVKRCNTCARMIMEEACPQNHQDGFFWSVRISGKLTDATNSINTVFNESLTCNILDRPISEILYHVSTGKQLDSHDFDLEVFTLDVPGSLSVNEAVVVEDPLVFRSSDKLIVPDRYGLRIYFPNNLNFESNLISELKQLELKPSNENHLKIIAKLVEKALDITLRQLTGCPKIHGIYLLERPIHLYGSERANLYIGLELEVRGLQGRLEVECHPKTLVTESILDYVMWRRERGASVNSVKKSLLTWRSDVVLAPNGARGKICAVIFKKADEFTIPVTEQTLPQFWMYTHGIDVDPEEKPLLIVKPKGLDVKLTYPASCAFLDESHVLYSYFKANTQRFIDRKVMGLRTRVLNTMLLALDNLSIGDQKIRLTEIANTKGDMQRLLIHDIKERLLGRNVKASGSIVKAGERLYFLPKIIDAIY